MGNPLRTAQDRRLPRIPEPCALVIFGVTGDLSRKKLIRAVYDLANRGLLPPGFVVLGFARRDWGDGDFESLALESGLVAKATATWVWVGLEKAVHLTVGGQEGGLAQQDVARGRVVPGVGGLVEHLDGQGPHAGARADEVVLGEELLDELVGLVLLFG